MEKRTETLFNSDTFKNLRRMRSDIYVAIQAYWLWHEIIELRSKSNKNNGDAHILNIYHAFFQPIERGLWDSFVIGLYKPFDEGNKVLNIKKLNKIAHQEGIMDLKKFIEKFNLIKNDNKLKELIEKKLKTIRDKQCAHTDADELNIDFKHEDIESLIKRITIWFKELSTYFDYGPSLDEIEIETKNTFKFLLKDLEIGKK